MEKKYGALDTTAYINFIFGVDIIIQATSFNAKLFYVVKCDIWLNNTHNTSLYYHRNNGYVTTPERVNTEWDADCVNASNACCVQLV
jgi:hypothetical protein